MISDTNEKTEPPPPLTDREMNQFIMLAALPTLERALERLRWLEAENADLKERIDKAYEDIALDQRTNETLRAELAALKAQSDPLDAMWAALESYQEQADRDGHGESWRRMCEKRTANAAWDAYHSAPSWNKSSGLWSMRAAADAARAANFGNHAKDAMDQIRRAKEAKR
jgi:hypothetical protein